MEKIKKQPQTREYQRNGLEATSCLLQFLIRINDILLCAERMVQ